MTSFTSKVQNRGIANPLQKTFKLEEWLIAYAEHASPDGADVSLGLAGAIFSQKLTKFWMRFGELDLRRFDTRELKKGLVAVCNRNLAVMHSKIEPEIKEEASKKPMLGLEVLSHKIELPFDGSRCSPDDLLTAGVDGVQGPLKLIFEGGRPAGEKPDIHTIQRLAILGQVHSMIVTLWEDCLWNGYRFHAHPEGFAFHPRLQSAKLQEPQVLLE